MTCQEIQHWLLLSKPAEALPAAVRRHLEACPRCRLRCEQLRLLDEQVCSLPSLPPNPAAKSRLLDRVAQTPQDRPFAPLRLHRRWVVAAAVAASLLIAVTWIIARRPAASSDVAVKEPSNPSPLRAGAGGIVLRVAKRDVLLASPAAIEEQLDILTQLADDLKGEAMRLARQGPSEDVTLLGDLCANVLRQGVVGRAARLPADKRPKLVPPLLEQLRAMEEEIDRFCKDNLPAIADMLRPISTAARESADHIEKGESQAEGVQVAPPDGPPPPLIASLVWQGLKLAEENDPVHRADLSADLASQLTPAIVLLSASGDAQGAEELGDCLGDLLGQGVSDNLAKAEADGIPEGQRDEVKKVRERSEEVMSDLAENLEHAPPAARPGLQRAIDASAAKPGKGKIDAPKVPGRTKPRQPKKHSRSVNDNLGK